MFKEYSGADAIVVPPFVYLSDLKTEKLKNPKFKNLKLASQDVFWEDKGAYTGEISAKMLKDFGVEYVIIGHSERRRHLNETDEMINKKVKAALSSGLKVILCVGEDLKTRKKGKKAVESFIKKQLVAGLKGLGKPLLKSKGLIIAYEPIWAIGTGVPCSAEQARETIRFIKVFLDVNVLYGGSVDSQNIKDFVELNEIGGVLVGGASLKKEEIKKIIKLTN